jgi:hypothetical protein
VAIHCVALALALVVLALPASAGADIYWAGVGGGSGGIGRANLDGSEPDQSFLPGLPNFAPLAPAVAVDGSHIYWTGLTYEGISRANLDGSEVIPNFVPGATARGGITVSGPYIYWSTDVGIGRADLDGSSADNAFVPETGEGTAGVAVFANHIYWTNRALKYIGSATIEGVEDPEHLFFGPEYLGGGIVATENGLYFDNGEKGIGFTNFTGNFIVESDVPGAYGVGLAVSGKYIYWAAGDAGVGRANLDGSEFTHSFITTARPAYGVAVDSAGAAAPPATGNPPVPPSPAGPPPPRPPPPSPPNTFSLGKAKLLRKSGDASLTVTLPGPGKLVLEGKGLLRVTEAVKRKGSVALTIKPNRQTKKTLEKNGKAKVIAKITFTPTAGTPHTESKTLTLKS